jgi:hypothetical protein
MPSYYVAFWNVENLFDVDGAPDRPQWLQRALARKVAGWDSDVLGQKIGQLARIIRQMNGGAGRLRAQHHAAGQGPELPLAALLQPDVAVARPAARHPLFR